MKQRKCLFTNALTLLAASALLTTSCIDNEKNYFDSDKVKDLYESGFPVQNIDPNMDWKTTQNISAVVAVNEDYGVNYKIRIYDANPLIEGSNAKLLTEGYANQDLKFTTSFDCPASTSMVYVARTDEKNRTVVQPILVDANGINVNFGAKTASTRSGETDPVRAAYTMSAPYSDSQIESMLAQATEIQQGWNLGAFKSWNTGMYGNYDVFDTPNDQRRYFKITSDCTDILYATGDATMTILINSKVTLTSTPELSGAVEIIVLPGGELDFNNVQFTLSNTSNIVIMPQAPVNGGTLKITNASNGVKNYNGGKTTLNSLWIDCSGGTFYNANDLVIQNLNINNDGTALVNNGNAYIGKSMVNSTIVNLCNLTVNEFNGSLIMANNCAATFTHYNKDCAWSKNLQLGANSMLTIKETATFNQKKVTGPTTDGAIIIINNLIGVAQIESKNLVYYEINNDSAITNPSERDFMKNLNISGQGEAPITIPAGECTGNGYGQVEEGQPLPSESIEYTYAYEDNFPSVGDYDFNDVVMDVKTTYNRLTTNNNIQSATINVTLKAVGGIKNSGAAIRLVGINKSDIASIAFSGDVNMRNTLTNSMFQNADMEDGNEVIIPLFGDSHGVFGRSEDRPMINTGFGQTLDTHTLDITLTPSNQNSPTPFIGKDTS